MHDAVTMAVVSARRATLPWRGLTGSCRTAGPGAAYGMRAVAPYLADTPGADVLVVAGIARSIALYAVAIARAPGAGRMRTRRFSPTS